MPQQMGAQYAEHSMYNGQMMPPNAHYYAYAQQQAQLPGQMPQVYQQIPPGAVFYQAPMMMPGVHGGVYYTTQPPLPGIVCVYYSVY